MATIMESMRRLGVEPPEPPNFTSEDLPYLIMAAMLGGDSNTTYGLLVALAMKIEVLENELFALKFGEKDD